LVTVAVRVTTWPILMLLLGPTAKVVVVGVAASAGATQRARKSPQGAEIARKHAKGLA